MSSARIKSAEFNASIALSDMSLRFPIGVDTTYNIVDWESFNNIKLFVIVMEKKVKKNSEEKIKENVEKQIRIRKEIEVSETLVSEHDQKPLRFQGGSKDATNKKKVVFNEQIAIQQKKIGEKKTKKKDEKLEEIVEKSKKKDEKPVSGDYLKKGESAYNPNYEKIDYEKLFSYLGSGARKIIEEYGEIIGADTSIAWTDERGDKDVMDNKELNNYAMKQATNFLLGTNMNNISYEEKIRFNAFMADSSNKIVFLINYAMLGMNYKTPVIKTHAYETKLTDKEIKEKSMKNDKEIALRFDLKSSSAKNYVK